MIKMQLQAKKEASAENKPFYIARYFKGKIYSCTGPFKEYNDAYNSMYKVIINDYNFLNLSRKNNNETFLLGKNNEEFIISYIKAKSEEIINNIISKLSETSSGLEVSNETTKDLEICEMAYYSYKIIDNLPKEKISKNYFTHIFSGNERELTKVDSVKVFNSYKSYNDAVNELLFQAIEISKHLIPTLKDSRLTINSAMAQYGEVQIIEENSIEQKLRKIVWLFPCDIAIETDTVYYE